MARQIRWIRQERGLNTSLLFGSQQNEKPCLGMGDLGFEHVIGEPLYDNGLYFVVDSVRDLTFDVLCTRDGMPGYFTARTVQLDKYEAIRIADEMKEADERVQAEDTW